MLNIWETVNTQKVKLLCWLTQNHLWNFKDDFLSQRKDEALLSSGVSTHTPCRDGHIPHVILKLPTHTLLLYRTAGSSGTDPLYETRFNISAHELFPLRDPARTAKALSAHFPLSITPTDAAALLLFIHSSFCCPERWCTELTVQTTGEEL